MAKLQALQGRLRSRGCVPRVCYCCTYRYPPPDCLNWEATSAIQATISEIIAAATSIAMGLARPSKRLSSEGSPKILAPTIELMTRAGQSPATDSANRGHATRAAAARISASEVSRGRGDILNRASLQVARSKNN